MVEVLEATRALADADDVADGLAILARELTRLFDASACMISRYDVERRVTTDWAGFVKPPGSSIGSPSRTRSRASRPCSPCSKNALSLH